jgi:acetyl-CoA synthetase
VGPAEEDHDVKPSPRQQAASWKRFVERVRSNPDLPFHEQWREFNTIFAGRREEDGPPPVWSPGRRDLERSNLGRIMAEGGFASYDDLHKWSTERRAEFWEMVLSRLGIAFVRAPRTILDTSGGAAYPRWLSGARLNCVDSCFRAAPDKTAIVDGGEGRARTRNVSYGQLERLVNRVANGLLASGFLPGEGIAIYMPMTIECVAAYLGILRAGCHVVSIADSFSPREVARRLEIGKAVGIVTVDRFTRGGKAIELFSKVREASASRAIVVIDPDAPRAELRKTDMTWEELLADETDFSSHAGGPEELTTVLFSSGTTGDPKAIPWSHLTAIKAAMDGHFHQDIQPDDVVAWPTNIGWMMGPWLIYASMMNHATMALYQGAPNQSRFTRFVRDAGVTVLGVVPSLVRAWRSSGIDGDLWRGVRLFSSTGEPSNVEDYLWLMSRTGYRAPVIEYCGGTEIGGGYVTGTVVQPASPATFTTPALGLDLLLVDEDGGFVEETGSGEVYLLPPSIGLSHRLLNGDHDEIYYRGCPEGPTGATLRRHGDRLSRLPGGCYRARGRADDTMNLGGIKVGSLEIETVLGAHSEVSESAAIGVQPGGQGVEHLVVFVRLASETDRERLRQELGGLVAERLNPLFKIHDLVVVDELPRTASNKLMRRELRARYAEHGSDR